MYTNTTITNNSNRTFIKGLTKEFIDLYKNLELRLEKLLIILNNIKKQNLDNKISEIYVSGVIQQLYYNTQKINHIYKYIKQNIKNIINSSVIFLDNNLFLFVLLNIIFEYINEKFTKLMDPLLFLNSNTVSTIISFPNVFLMRIPLLTNSLIKEQLINESLKNINQDYLLMKNITKTIDFLNTMYCVNTKKLDINKNIANTKKLEGGSSVNYINIKGIGRRKIRSYKNGKLYVIIKGKKVNL